MALTQGTKLANNVPDGYPGHTNGLFGSKVRMADKGRILVVLEHEFGTFNQAVGLTHIYTRDSLDTDWNKRQSISPPLLGGSVTYSQGAIAINETGEWLAVQNAVVVGGNTTQQVRVYRRTAENTWTLNQVLVHPLDSGTVLSDGTRANQGSLGGSISFSQDGSMLVCSGTKSDNLTEGAAYIFVRDAINRFIRVQEINETSLGISSTSGWKVRASGNSTYVLIHAPRDGGLPDKGQIFVFKRVGVTDQWALDAGPLTNDYETLNNHDLRDLQINYDGTTFVAVYTYFSGATAPVFQCMKRSGSTWSVSHTKTGLTPWTVNEFAIEIATNFNGTRAVIGAHAGLGTDTGRFWLLVENSDETWTITEQYEDSTGLNGDQFGDSVAMSYSGLNFSVGASNNTNQFARTGSVYSFYSDGFGAFIDYSQSFQGSDVLVEGYRGVKLERSNVTGVINEFFSDLVDRLELYVDGEGDSLLQVQVDMNDKQVNNLGDAVYSDDLIPKSQAEALV